MTQLVEKIVKPVRIGPLQQVDPIWILIVLAIVLTLLVLVIILLIVCAIKNCRKQSRKAHAAKQAAEKRSNFATHATSAPGPSLYSHNPLVAQGKAAEIKT